MVDVQDEAVAAILTRAPSAGGKSRLFQALGLVPDVDLLTALFLDTLDNVIASSVTPVVCYTPASAEEELRTLVPRGTRLLPQREGDLGARMRAAFDDLFSGGARAVVLVGSDLPLLDPDSVSRTMERLTEHPRRVILGPSRDGGYYLIGATRTPVGLFDGITWSTPSVFADTLRRADEHRIELNLLPLAADVDTAEDLRAVIDGDRSRGVRTRAWAQRLYGRA